MKNSSFGTLSSGSLTLAPSPVTLERSIVIDGITHEAGAMLYTDRADVMIRLGYKPIVYTPMPMERENYTWTSGWAESEDAITRTWTEIPSEDSIRESDYIEALDGLGVNMSEA